MDIDIIWDEEELETIEELNEIFNLQEGEIWLLETLLMI